MGRGVAWRGVAGQGTDVTKGQGGLKLVPTQTEV